MPSINTILTVSVINMNLGDYDKIVDFEMYFESNGNADYSFFEFFSPDGTASRGTIQIRYGFNNIFLQFGGYNPYTIQGVSVHGFKDEWARVTILLPNAHQTDIGMNFYVNGQLEGKVPYATTGNSNINTANLHHTGFIGPKVAVGLIQQHNDGGATPLPINVRHFYYEISKDRINADLIANPDWFQKRAEVTFDGSDTINLVNIPEDATKVELFRDGVYLTNLIITDTAASIKIGTSGSYNARIYKGSYLLVETPVLNIEEVFITSTLTGGLLSSTGDILTKINLSIGSYSVADSIIATDDSGNNITNSANGNFTVVNGTYHEEHKRIEMLSYTNETREAKLYSQNDSIKSILDTHGGYTASYILNIKGYYGYMTMEFGLKFRFESNGGKIMWSGGYDTKPDCYGAGPLFMRVSARKSATTNTVDKLSILIINMSTKISYLKEVSVNLAFDSWEHLFYYSTGAWNSNQKLADGTPAYGVTLSNIVVRKSYMNTIEYPNDDIIDGYRADFWKNVLHVDGYKLLPPLSYQPGTWVLSGIQWSYVIDGTVSSTASTINTLNITESNYGNGQYSIVSNYASVDLIRLLNIYDITSRSQFKNDNNEVDIIITTPQTNGLTSYVLWHYTHRAYESPTANDNVENTIEAGTDYHSGSWDVCGKNDSATWDLIHSVSGYSRSGIQWPSDAYTQHFITNAAQYSEYKITFKTFADATYFRLYGIQLFSESSEMSLTFDRINALNLVNIPEDATNVELFRDGVYLTNLIITDTAASVKIGTSGSYNARIYKGSYLLVETPVVVVSSVTNSFPIISWTNLGTTLSSDNGDISFITDGSVTFDSVNNALVSNGTEFVADSTFLRSDKTDPLWIEYEIWLPVGTSQSKSFTFGEGDDTVGWSGQYIYLHAANVNIDFEIILPKEQWVKLAFKRNKYSGSSTDRVSALQYIGDSYDEITHHTGAPMNAGNNYLQGSASKISLFYWDKSGGGAQAGIKIRNVRAYYTQPENLMRNLTQMSFNGSDTINLVNIPEDATKVELFRDGVSLGPLLIDGTTASVTIGTSRSYNARIYKVVDGLSYLLVETPVLSTVPPLTK